MHSGGTRVAIPSLMKTKSKWLALSYAVIALSVASGCSTIKGEKSAQNLNSNGPTVVSVTSRPGTVELNQQLQPQQKAEIVAEVKDFTSKITDVNLRFLNVPMTLPMTHVGGTTWSASLSPEQLKVLAVGGQTINYTANVIARNEDGQTAVSQDPVTVSVKTPDLTQPVG